MRWRHNSRRRTNTIRLTRNCVTCATYILFAQVDLVLDKLDLAGIVKYNGGFDARNIVSVISRSRPGSGDARWVPGHCNLATGAKEDALTWFVGSF